MIKQPAKAIDRDMEANGRRHQPHSKAGAKQSQLRIFDLGWTREEAIDTHFRLRPFEEEWNEPDMDVYDDL